MKSFLFGLALTVSVTNVWATDISFTTNVKSKAILNALEEIKSELPESLKVTIPNNIQITFSDLNKTAVNNIDDKCSDRIILGIDTHGINQNKILVDNVFVKELDRGNRSIKCAHKSIKNYFKATVAHELAHLFDDQKKISNNSLFLNIAGWINKGMIIRRKTNLNQRQERSPDPYEFKNSQETFAVNFEHFLYDPNYKCHRPTYYEFYSKLFGSKPNDAAACETNNKIVMTSDSSTSSSDNAAALIKNLDLSKLYQVHYLFAGKGEAAMSRFGHAMFRLVMCAPEHEVGPQCMNDVGSHIVLSFRANIQETTTSYSKGINGEYPSQLFFLPLKNVIDEYTKGEFREITSIPLKLNIEQKRRFLQRSLELFWSYRGKYYFFTNNCATEAMNLLRVTLGEYDDAQTKNIATPIGLYNYLVKIGLSDTSVLSNMKDAQLKGYFYPGISQKISDSMAKLNIQEKDFQKFAANYDATKRIKLYQTAIASNSNKVLMAANALRLEDLILFSEEMGFAKELGAKLFGSDPDPRLQNTVLGSKIIELQKIYAELNPENFLTLGYGIPLDSEFDTIPQEKFDEVKSKVNEYTEDMKSIAGEFFPEKLEEIKNTTLNRYELLKVISEKIKNDNKLPLSKTNNFNKA